MFANATVSFEQIVSSYPGPLSLVSVLVSLALLMLVRFLILLHAMELKFESTVILFVVP